MIELLILYELYEKVLTMYGISKEIRAEFSMLMTPSYGTIKPALNRLLKSGCIKSQKVMSEGGRPSVYYSITNDGKTKLIELILAKPLENPIQFLSISRVKIYCCSILSKDEQLDLFNKLLQKANIILSDAQNIVKSKNGNFYTNIVLDNLMCEYKNFISLLSGLEKTNK